MNDDGDEKGNFLEKFNGSLDATQKTLELLKTIGFDPRQLRPWLHRNITNVLNLFLRNNKTSAGEAKLQLDPEDAAHFLPAAAKAADPDLQEMFANLLGEAVNPNRQKSRVRQDMRTLEAFTPAPEALAVLCYLVKKWPDGVELDLHELACKLADNVNINCDSLRDALNLLVQQRCMAVADDHFHAGPVAIYGNEKGRESSIFVKYGREEFRVTELGRRIVKMYAPRQSGQATATEPNQPHL